MKNKERIIDTDDVVGEKFKLGRKIGRGAFGEVYAGVNLQSGEEVAIKLEPVTTEHPQLYHESEIYKRLQGGVGIPSLKWFGVERGHNIMVIELLGPNLQEILDRCGGKFSLKTVLMLANQLIEAMECMHDKGVIHRDIKPENLLMGLGSNVCQVYITDFGLAKLYIDPETDEHISYREHKSFVGAHRYASLYTHCGVEQSRRVDVESLGYVLVYFLKGSLPWQGISAGSNEEELNHKLMIKKFNTKPEELCESCPSEFAAWVKCMRLTLFSEMPSYIYLKAITQRLFKSKGYKFDYVYDWTISPKDNIKLGASAQKPIRILAAQDIHDTVDAFSRTRIFDDVRSSKDVQPDPENDNPWQIAGGRRRRRQRQRHHVSSNGGYGVSMFGKSKNHNLI
ncbi:unnamed protein product [Lactuca virosa]|uniref:non-specific serine/threonine protein kinase n=1 Tax=Lactuca virosa TaxID=75947 RepID=A0AAU9MKL1_9ASTR|nr:unnamed protein product [Lactuca virosa]